MDVADEDSTIAAYDAAERSFGVVDTVIANAGVSPAGSALGLSVDDFDLTVSVNLRGVFLTVREGARRMVASDIGSTGSGRVLLIRSVIPNFCAVGGCLWSKWSAASH